jgi:hypothetical protein
MTDMQMIAASINRLAQLADQGNPFARYVMSEVNLRVRMAASLAGEVAAVTLEITASDPGDRDGEVARS